MSIRCAGNRPRDRQAIHRLVVMNGSRVFVTNQKSNAATVLSAYSSQLLTKLLMTICDHLAGKHTVGVYPLLADDTCFFLAADFDETDWRDDARAIMQSCGNLEI